MATTTLPDRHRVDEIRIHAVGTVSSDAHVPVGGEWDWFESVMFALALLTVLALAIWFVRGLHGPPSLPTVPW